MPSSNSADFDRAGLAGGAEVRLERDRVERDEAVDQPLDLAGGAEQADVGAAVGDDGEVGQVGAQDRAHQRHRLAPRAPAADPDRHPGAQLRDDLLLCHPLVSHLGFAASVLFRLRNRLSKQALGSLAADSPGWKLERRRQIGSGDADSRLRVALRHLPRSRRAPVAMYSAPGRAIGTIRAGTPWARCPVGTSMPFARAAPAAATEPSWRTAPGRIRAPTATMQRVADASPPR